MIDLATAILIGYEEIGNVLSMGAWSIGHSKDRVKVTYENSQALLAISMRAFGRSGKIVCSIRAEAIGARRR